MAHEDPGSQARPDSNHGQVHKQKTTAKMLFLAIWVSFAAWMGAFDLGYGGTVLIMPSFQKAFGHCAQVSNPKTGTTTEKCALSALQQSLTSLSFLFMAVGSALAGLFGSKLGRKGTMQTACLFCIIGAAGMLGTTGSFTNYMVCKCISGVGIGQLYASSIVYGSECVIASKRGLLLGLYNVGLAMGTVVAAAVCAGSASLAADDDWQWKTPIACQIPLGVIVASGLLMFPESPRWLLLKGKEGQARKAFGALQKRDPDAPEVAVQIEDIQKHLEIERTTDASASWMEIYRGINLRRTAVSALILIGLSITGVQFVSPYAALFFNGVGVENPYLINAIVGLCIFAGACVGPFILDHGGRRFSMLVGYTLMAACMLIFSSVSTALGEKNPTSQSVVVAFICIWAFVFGGFIGPSTWLASAEMHSVRLRTYGQANTTLCYDVFSFGAYFWTPYMLNPDYGNMGSNVGYFYFGVTVGVLILTFLFVPETTRLTLEQIDDFFLSRGSAWRTSTAKNTAIARGTALSGLETTETMHFSKEATQSSSNA